MFVDLDFASGLLIYPFVFIQIPFFHFQVNITVADINDNAPEFTSGQVTTSVSEAINSLVTIYSAHAVDIDSKENGNGVVLYSLVENPHSMFVIDPTSGDVHLAEGIGLDFEDTTQHTLVISAVDQGKNGRRTSSMTLIVNVQDANDNAPVFEQSHFVASVSENASLNTKFKQITASDRDSGENGRITYSLLDAEGSDRFGIFPSDGFMYLKKTVDYEDKSDYSFTVVARDHGQPTRSASAQVTVYINDYNDNTPVFSASQYHFYIEENLPSGTSVGTVSATDADTGLNAQLRYEFNPMQDDFFISSEGVISTTRTLDREVTQDYSIEVRANDSGITSLEAKVRVHITVTDVNDHAPEIRNSPLVANVEENQSKGVRVVKIMADDPDAGVNGSVSFSLALLNDGKFTSYTVTHFCNTTCRRFCSGSQRLFDIAADKNCTLLGGLGGLQCLLSPTMGTGQDDDTFIPRVYIHANMCLIRQLFTV